MVTKAFRAGFSRWSSRIGDAMDYAVIITCIMLMPVAPLLFLSMKQLNAYALAAVPLFVLLVLPVRINAGRVLRDVCRGADCMSSSSLVLSGHYSARLAQGLKMCLLLLVWAIPGLAATVYAIILYKGAADAIVIMQNVLRIGGGDIIKGAGYVLLIYAACWLPLVIGMMLHSGTRYAGSGKLLKGHRGQLCVVWLCSLLLFLPFVIAEVFILRNGISPVITALKNFQLDGLSDVMMPMLWQSLAAVVLLVLPLVPLRHLIIASYVDALAGEEKKA